MTPRFRSGASGALLLALVLSPLAACDSSDDGDLTDGSFEVQVSGDAQVAFDGPAAFAVETEGNQTISAIGMVNGDDEEEAVFLVMDGQPAVKTYTVDDETVGALLILHETDDEGGLYAAESGSIKVSSVSTARLAGSFDVTAVNIFDEDDTVRVKGTFNAKAGAVTPPDEIEDAARVRR